MTEFFYQAGTRVLEFYGQQANFLHLDSSGLHLHAAQEAELLAISITDDYTRDHIPDMY